MNVERRAIENGDDESEDFSDSTCSSCCYSDASIPEWDNSIQENGELFFLKCSPITPDVRPNDEEAGAKVVRSKSNKFSNFLRKPKLKKSKNASKEKKHDSSSPSPQDGNEDPASRSWAGLDSQSTEPTMSVLFLNLASIDSNESSIADTFYSFPQPRDNLIYSIRGALMTLYHHLPKLVCEKLESSTIFVKEETVQLIYVKDQKGLMILACPESRCPLFNFKQLGISIKHYFVFRYGSLHDAFSNPSHHVNLNQFFGNLFIKLLSSKFISSTEVHNFNLNERRSGTRFEETFIYPRALSIPYDLMSKIHEKLNELEANDFGDLSEDHYGCQRLFLIIGTCLYCKGGLVVSHLNPDDLVAVNSFLCLNDILDLTVTSVMESLIVWQEVFLPSGDNENIRSSPGSNKRWFLLIVGRDHCLLVVLLETGGCAVNYKETSRPDELYVDQVQDTLNDVLHLGLLDEVGQYAKNTSSNSTKTRRKSSCRSADSSTLNLNQVFNGTCEDTFSESVSRTTSSAVSDEIVPVMGRRAQRLQKLSHSSSIYTLSQSNLSDSESSDCDTTGSSQANSSIGSRSFSKNSPLPKKILHGDEKALFHYVNLRINKGVIYSMDTFHVDASRHCQSVVSQFELAAQRIHTLFAQKEYSSGSRFSRNDLTVKECGTLYEYCGVEDEEEKKSAASTLHWTVGRNLNKPNLGEVYVCFEDKTPQNMIEVAFRLATTS